jgi:pilus assembly protein CpaE
MPSLIQPPESLHPKPLIVAVVSPDRQHRIAATDAVAQCGNVEPREFPEYPPNLTNVASLLGQGFDAVLIDLDGNQEYALALVEKLCTEGSTIVMVFSGKADSELILRSMHAGAREFFTVPFTQSSIAKALQWVVAQRQPISTARKADGRQLIFFGSKGGAGVTTVATNFAVAIAEESLQSTLLIDLNLHLGDAAMNLGIDAPYSIVDALQNATHLDAHLLAKLVVRHDSGLSVLAAPAELPANMATNVAIGSLLQVARRQFHYVVVDAGKKIDLKQMHLFEESATAYLVTQIGIPELRNANRLIAQFTADNGPKLEVVINRHQSRSTGLSDEHLAKALNRTIHWKIPNDYAAVRKMQSTAIPIVHQDSSIAGVIRQMARSVCGTSAAREGENARGFSVAGLRFPWKPSAKSAIQEKIKTEPDQPQPLPHSLPEPFLR